MYTEIVRNITLTADESLIEAARTRARAEKRTLNEVFRLWLRRYVRRDAGSSSYDALMSELSYVEAGRTFSRAERNER